MGNSLTSAQLKESIRPGIDLFPITPDDDNELPQFARALRCTVAGVVTVLTANNTIRTWEFFNAGDEIECGVKKVFANSPDSPSVATTATVEGYL